MTLAKMHNYTVFHSATKTAISVLCSIYKLPVKDFVIPKNSFEVNILKTLSNETKTKLKQTMHANGFFSYFD